MPRPTCCYCNTHHINRRDESQCAGASKERLRILQSKQSASLQTIEAIQGRMATTQERIGNTEKERRANLRNRLGVKTLKGLSVEFVLYTEQQSQNNERNFS